MFIWVCVLKSGVHATLAGVVVAHRHPAAARKARASRSLLEQLEESLHPWVAFGMLPLFAFANAGVSLQGLSLAKLLEPVPLGIALGLFLGKPIGIFGGDLARGHQRACAEAGGRQLGSAARRRHAGRHRLHHEPVHRHAGLRRAGHAAQLRLGVLAGSLLSAIAGYPGAAPHRRLSRAWIAGMILASSVSGVIGPTCL